MKRQQCLWLGIAILLLTACGVNNSDRSSGPRLIGEEALEPTTPAPTRIITPTPTFVPAQPEVVSSLNEVTVEADFVLVTPTLPPSKTPTLTPTMTLTPTVTPTPTITVTATATVPQFPTSVIIPVTAIVAQPIPQVCDSTWFFIQPRPASCPLSAPLAGQGVYQEFQNGYMIWLQVQDTIYIMYNDTFQPRWQFYSDTFEEGMPEFSGDYLNSPFPNTWQPRRGFGMLWRNNQVVRDRIGWATMEWEQPYSVSIQRAPDGTTFIGAPDGSLFSLARGGTNWQRFVGATGS